MKRYKPQIIGDIIRQIIKQRRLGTGLYMGEIYNAYDRAVGPYIASKTNSKVLRNRVLYCYVNSSVARKYLIENRLNIMSQINSIVKAGSAGSPQEATSASSVRTASTGSVQAGSASSAQAASTSSDAIINLIVK